MKDKPTTSKTGIVTEKPNPPKKASKSHDSLLEDFENHLSCAERLAFVKEIPTHLTCEEKASLSNSIARSERQTIWQEAAVISTQSNCHDGVKKFNSNERAEWVSQRNKTLLAFVIGLTGLQYPCSGAFPQMIILCMVLEHLYHMTYPRLLAPNSFLFSLFLYNKTGSWSAVDMLGKILPSGSYKTITGFLRGVAPDKHFVPKDGVIINTFDNQQVLTYKKSIDPPSATKCSVITIRLASILNPSKSNKEIQKQQSLKPICKFKSSDYDLDIKMHAANPSLVEKIRKDKKDFEKCVNEICNIEGHYTETVDTNEEIHNREWERTVQSTLKIVSNDQEKMADGCFGDFIDTHVLINDKTTITCDVCKTANQRRKLICVKCGERSGLARARQKTVDI